MAKNALLNQLNDALRGEVTDLLRAHLLPGTFTETLPTKADGGLPLNIPFVRVEPWVYGVEAVTFAGAWSLCVESAAYYSKTPVLAHQWHGGWSFRVSLYMLNSEFEATMVPENRHRFDWSVDLSVEAFALAVAEYQEECGSQRSAVEIIDSVLGVRI